MAAHDSVLIARDGFTTDSWRRVDDELTIPDGDVIVPLPRVSEFTRRPDGSGRLGILVACDTPAIDIEVIAPTPELVSIAFPSSADGRGFSLAKQLRARGYTGTLRAFGPVIADQFGFALSCGFDEVEVPADLAARQPQAQWLAFAPEAGLAYQTGYAGTRSILEARHRRARKRGGDHDCLAPAGT